MGAAAGGTVALALAFFLLGPMLWRHQLPVRDTRPASSLPMPRTASESLERRTVDEIVKAQSEVLTQRFEQTR